MGVWSVRDSVCGVGVTDASIQERGEVTGGLADDVSDSFVYTRASLNG